MHLLRVASEFEFLYPLSFVAVAKTVTKLKTYPDKKFIQDTMLVLLMLVLLGHWRVNYFPYYL